MYQLFSSSKSRRLDRRTGRKFQARLAKTTYFLLANGRSAGLGAASAESAFVPRDSIPRTRDNNFYPHQLIVVFFLRARQEYIARRKKVITRVLSYSVVRSGGGEQIDGPTSGSSHTQPTPKIMVHSPIARRRDSMR